MLAALGCTKPVISITNNNEKLIISVKHDKAIETVSYQWDDSEIKVIKGTGESSISLEEIGLSAGTHTLKVTAVDTDGVESYMEETYTSESGVDIIPPTIDIQPNIETHMITVVATDETGISYITITVDNSEEKTIYATEQENNDGKTINYSFKVDSEQSSYTICAVDTSNNQYVKSNVKTYKKPKIELGAEPDYSKVYVYVTSEIGLKKVQYVLNGKTYEKEFQEGEDNKEFNFLIPTEVGENEITVTADTGIEDVVEVVSGTCTYNP